MADESETIPVVVAPPAPPVVAFTTGKNLMKCPASLIGKRTSTGAKRSVLDQCKDVVMSRFGLTEHSHSWLYFNNEVEACLQDGPTCGLVALKLCSDIVKVPGDVATQNKCSESEIIELLQLSKDSGFTLEGEMFSARDMAVLAKLYYDMNFKVVQTGLEDYVSLVNHVLQGCPVLVPYDADKNNEPCLRKGHKAHWAVITGFLLGLENNSNRGEDSHDISIRKVEKFPFDSNFGSDNLFLVTRHGKSRHYGIWSWNELVNSNKNLHEFDRGDLTGNYLLTEGIQEGLCSKALFFNPEL